MIIKRCLYALSLLCALGISSCGDDNKSQNEEENSQTDPEKQDPEKQDPEKQDPEKQDPEKQDPEKQDPEKQDPEKPSWPDSDGDTISDYYEYFDSYHFGKPEEGATFLDTDKDNIPDYLDTDSDGDTIPDSVEAMNGGDTREAPKSGMTGYMFRSLDSDDNGIPDNKECKYGVDLLTATDVTVESCDDIDGDQVPDFADDDDDGDGLMDILEIKGISIQTPFFIDCNNDGVSEEEGSSEKPFDCDGDTIPDYRAPDSDGDTIGDIYEGMVDSNRDGILDRYSLDSDGDTIPDRSERGPELKPVDTDEDTIPDYSDLDSDNDGLADSLEVICDNLDNGDSRIFWDTDKDGTSDMAEYLFAVNNNIDAKDLICDPARTAKEFVEFYFELKRDSDEEKTDTLSFKPLITKADVLVNIDHTGSMETMIKQIHAYFGSVVAPAVRVRVPDTNFGVSQFGDKDASPLWQLIQAPTDNITTFTEKLKSVKQNMQKTDTPEAGFESLYMIANGGVEFRKGALPIVIHITNAQSHESYKTEAINKLSASGIRVMPLYNIFYDAQSDTKLQASQSKDMALGTNARVPVCAFKKSDDSWMCGINQCCTGMSELGKLKGVAPDADGYCNLAFQTFDLDDVNVDNTNVLAWQAMIGVEALVKYSTYTVSTRIIGEPIPDDDAVDGPKDTSCFIQRIEAAGYLPPATGPESECAAKTQPEAFIYDTENHDYKDAFKNFAVGAATPDSPTSTLTFNVVATNNGCVKEYSEPRKYNAKIEVYDPITNLVFDSQTVMIIVPGEFKDKPIIY